MTTEEAIQELRERTARMEQQYRQLEHERHLLLRLLEMTELPYPEHEKAALYGYSGHQKVVQNFYDFLSTKFHFCEYQQGDDYYYDEVYKPVEVNQSQLLSEFFDVDFDKYLLEKEEMERKLRGEAK